MEDVTYISKAETRSIKGDRIVLYYFIAENRQTAEDNALSYCVGIDMYTQLPGERTLKERKVSDAVFRTRKEAEHFLDIICNGTVTPTTLREIIEDYTEDLLRNINA